jgi:hypothetical protein
MGLKERREVSLIFFSLTSLMPADPPAGRGRDRRS